LRRQYQNARFELRGFSSGGGFALRVAAGKLSCGFGRLVFLSPFLGYDAPSTRRPDSSATWAAPGIPRYLDLSILRRLGLGEALPVIAFAVGAGNEKYVTSIIIIPSGSLPISARRAISAPHFAGSKFRQRSLWGARTN
jgi:alpha-beta hydrolase superfamily lysophospholipase